MRIILMLALLLPAPLAAARPADRDCPKPSAAPGRAEFKRLGDLPPAEAFNAVLREDSRCRGTLVQARDRIGSVPRR